MKSNYRCNICNFARFPQEIRAVAKPGGISGIRRLVCPRTIFKCKLRWGLVVLL